MSDIAKYFEAKAFTKITEMIEEKKKANIYHCHSCEEELDSEYVIMCDGCLFWYECECVQLDESNMPAEGDPWFCRDCLNDYLQQVKSQ